MTFTAVRVGRIARSLRLEGVGNVLTQVNACRNRLLERAAGACQRLVTGVPEGCEFRKIWGSSEDSIIVFFELDWIGQHQFNPKFS